MRQTALLALDGPGARRLTPGPRALSAVFWLAHRAQSAANASCRRCRA